MYRSTKVNLYFIYFFIFLPFFGSAQQNLPTSEDLPFVKHQFEFTHDNDFLFATDYYYTTGSFIGYRTLLNTPLIKSGKEQMSFVLTHQFYTPSNILSTNIEDFDRPYAGFLGINIGWTHTYKSNLVSIEALMGMIGPASGAEGFQNLFHETGGVGQPTAWIAQIENSFLTTLKVNYVKEWLVVPGKFNMRAVINPSAAVGTKDMYLQYENVFYFGKRNPLDKSSAYRQLGQLQNEFFFAARAAYRYVFHNALFEGNLWADSSEFLMESEYKFFLFSFEFYKRMGRNDFKIAFNYNSREAPALKAHLNLTLSYSRNF